MDTGVFALGGVRFRAHRCDDYLVADGDPDNAFVHLTARIGRRRDPDVRREVGGEDIQLPGGVPGRSLPGTAPGNLIRAD